VESGRLDDDNELNIEKLIDVARSNKNKER